MSGAIALGDNAALAAVSAPSAGHYLLFYRAGVLTKMASDGTETAVGGSGGSSPPFSDATALVKDDADATKLVRVDAGTVATATTRVLTMPNADVNLGALVNANIDAAAAIAESKLNLASDAAAGTASRRTLGTSATQAAAGNHSHAHSALTGIDTDTATTAIHHTLGTGANQAAAGNDSRLSDTRTPTDNTVTDAKVTAGAAIAESKLNLASDAAAGTASRRTLGTSSTSAAAGNDSRLSDTRVPTAHKTTHDPGGSDVIQRFHTIYWVFDGTLAVTTGNKQVPIFIPTGSNTPTLVSAAARITTAPTGSAVTFDLNKAGTTVWTGGTNRLTVAAAGNGGSTTTFDVATFASLDYFTVDIDTVGSTTAGTHAIFALTYRY